MTDIAPIRGLIELQDDFTSKIGLAEAALSNFSKENQESLKAVAEAAGLVTVAIGAVAAATIELGKRGAEVNDVRNTLDNFAGSADNAQAILVKLRSGTKGTVDDFELLRHSAHLLSAGVQLTADDFGLLGQAAFVLQNRGLGPTKDQLELVSNALVTGRTRALAMALGTVDITDAEERYAAKLGTTKDKLSDLGVAEAKRIAVMEMLRTAVRQAGNQERDFGEQIEAAKTYVANYVDELGQAVAKSPVLAAGMKTIGVAFGDAFGSDKEEQIKAIVETIESAATFAVNFGLTMIEAARVINVAWSVIKTTVLGVEFALVASMAGIARAAGLAHENLDAMADSLAHQMEEAAKGVVGHSEFDKTLDKLGGTLLRVKDAMTAASQSTKENTATADVAAENAKKLMATQQQLSKDMIDRVAVEKEAAAIEKKSVEETTKVWDEYFALRVAHGGTTEEAQRAQVQRWFDDEVSKLDKMDRNWQKHYDALEALSKEKMRSIGVDWSYLASHSIKALQEQADAARATYNEMIRQSGNFTRGVLEEQRAKVDATAAAARGMGKEFVSAEQSALAATKKQNDELEKQKKAADEAAKALNRAMGGSTQYDLSTAEGRAKVDPKIAKWLHDGYSLEQASALAQALAYGYPINQRDPLFATKGPRVPGFAEGVTNFEGGLALVGERGPELLNLPRGANVIPSGSVGGMAVTNHIYVNGTAADVARKVSEEIMRTLKGARQFGIN